MSIEKPLTVTTGILLAVGVFIVTVIVESIINVWIFKRMGGCPMVDVLPGQKGRQTPIRKSEKRLTPSEAVPA